ncbi:MAG: methyltransferase domain-containing protein, partial [Candidatus Omnitrophica bacterium]|nr:methyltransferase domain-containing protein [Candidatus Omnitrophota bacterium]
DAQISSDNDNTLRDVVGAQEDFSDKINLKGIEIDVKALIKKAIERYNRYELRHHRRAGRITPLKEFLLIQLLIENKSFEEVRVMAEKQFGHKFNTKQNMSATAWSVVEKLETKVKYNSLKPFFDFKKVEEKMGVPGLFGKISLRYNIKNSNKVVSSSPIYFRGLQPVKHFDSQAPPLVYIFAFQPASKLNSPAVMVSSPVSNIVSSEVKSRGKLSSILSSVIKGKNSRQRTKALVGMLSTNFSVDHFVTWPLKFYLSSAVYWFGSIEACILLTPVIFFFLGGIIRLFLFAGYKLIWRDSVHLTKIGLAVTFFPEIGNLAPITYVLSNLAKDRLAEVIYFTKDVNKISELIEISVLKYTHASNREIKAVVTHSLSLAEKIYYHQDKRLKDYNYRRFKIRGTKDYSLKRVFNLIKRQDLTDMLPTGLKLKGWLFKKVFNINLPGYKKGTRPILIIETDRERKIFKDRLLQTNTCEEFLSRIYYFDISKFSAELPRAKKGGLRPDFNLDVFIRPMFLSGSSPLIYNNARVPQLPASKRRILHIYENMIFTQERISQALNLLSSLRVESYRQTGLPADKNTEYAAVLKELKTILGKMRGTKNKITEANEITLMRQEIDLMLKSLKDGLTEGLFDSACLAMDLLEARKERLSVKMKSIEEKAKKVITQLILLEPQIPYDRQLAKSKTSIVISSEPALKADIGQEVTYKFYSVDKRFQDKIKEELGKLVKNSLHIAVVKVFYGDHKPAWLPQSREDLIEWLSEYYPRDNTFNLKEERQLRAIYYSVMRRTQFNVFINDEITARFCTIKVIERQDKKIKVEVENLASSPIGPKILVFELLNVLKSIRSKSAKAIFLAESNVLADIAKEVGLSEIKIDEEIKRVCQVLEQKFNMFLSFEDIKKIYLAAQMLHNPELVTRRNIQAVSGCMNEIYNSVSPEKAGEPETLVPLAELVDEYDEISRSGWENNGKGTYAVIYRDYRVHIAEIIGRGKNILSNGCGTGELEELLIARGNQVTGLDVSPGMVNAFKLRCPLAQALVANASTDLAGLFDKKVFDVIIFPESIGHMDIPVVLKESHRLLKEGGRLIITTYEPSDMLNNRLFKSYRRLSPSVLAKMAEDAQFKIIKKETMDFEEAEDPRYYMPGNVIVIVGLKDKTLASSSPVNNDPELNYNVYFHGTSVDKFVLILKDGLILPKTISSKYSKPVVYLSSLVYNKPGYFSSGVLLYLSRIKLAEQRVNFFRDRDGTYFVSYNPIPLECVVDIEYYKVTKDPLLLRKVDVAAKAAGVLDDAGYQKNRIWLNEIILGEKSSSPVISLKFFSSSPVTNMIDLEFVARRLFELSRNWYIVAKGNKDLFDYRRPDEHVIEGVLNGCKLINSNLETVFQDINQFILFLADLNLDIVKPTGEDRCGRNFKNYQGIRASIPKDTKNRLFARWFVRNYKKNKGGEYPFFIAAECFVKLIHFQIFGEGNKRTACQLLNLVLINFAGQQYVLSQDSVHKYFKMCDDIVTYRSWYGYFTPKSVWERKLVKQFATFLLQNAQKARVIRASSSPLMALKFEPEPLGRAKACLDGFCCFFEKERRYPEIESFLKTKYGIGCSIAREEVILTRLMAGDRESEVSKRFPCWPLQVIFDYSQALGITIATQCSDYHSRPSKCVEYSFKGEFGNCLYRQFLLGMTDFSLLLPKTSILADKVVLSQKDLGKLGGGVYFLPAAFMFFKEQIIRENNSSLPLKFIFVKDDQVVLSASSMVRETADSKAITQNLNEVGDKWSSVIEGLGRHDSIRKRPNNQVNQAFAEGYNFVQAHKNDKFGSKFGKGVIAFTSFLIEINRKVLKGTAEYRYSSNVFSTGGFSGIALEKFSRWFIKNNQKNINPYLFAARCYVKVLYLKLFEEGNHRSAFLLLNFVLLQRGLGRCFITTNNVSEYFNLANKIELNLSKHDPRVLVSVTFFVRQAIYARRVRNFIKKNIVDQDSPLSSTMESGKLSSSPVGFPAIEKTRFYKIDNADFVDGTESGFWFIEKPLKNICTACALIVFLVEDGRIFLAHISPYVLGEGFKNMIKDWQKYFFFERETIFKPTTRIMIAHRDNHSRFAKALKNFLVSCGLIPENIKIDPARQGGYLKTETTGIFIWPEEKAIQIHYAIWSGSSYEVERANQYSLSKEFVLLKGSSGLPKIASSAVKMLPDDYFTEKIKEAISLRDFAAVRISQPHPVQDRLTYTKITFMLPGRDFIGTEPESIPVIEQRLKINPAQLKMLNEIIEINGIQAALAGFILVFIKKQEPYYGVYNKHLFLDFDLLDESRKEELSRVLKQLISQREYMFAGLGNLTFELSDIRAIHPSRRSEELRQAMAKLAEEASFMVSSPLGNGQRLIAITSALNSEKLRQQIAENNHEIIIWIHPLLLENILDDYISWAFQGFPYIELAQIKENIFSQYREFIFRLVSYLKSYPAPIFVGVGDRRYSKDKIKLEVKKDLLPEVNRLFVEGNLQGVLIPTYFTDPEPVDLDTIAYPVNLSTNWERLQWILKVNLGVEKIVLVGEMNEPGINNSRRGCVISAKENLADFKVEIREAYTFPYAALNIIESASFSSPVSRAGSLNISNSVSMEYETYKDRITGKSRFRLNMSVLGRSIGSIFLALEKEGIVLYTCSDFKVEEGKRQRGYGSVMLPVAFTYAQKEANKLGLYPKWAFVYYRLNIRYDYREVLPIISLLEKLGFRTYSYEKDDPLINDEALIKLRNNLTAPLTLVEIDPWYIELDKLSKLFSASSESGISSPINIQVTGILGGKKISFKNILDSKMSIELILDKEPSGKGQVDLLYSIGFNGELFKGNRVNVVMDLEHQEISVPVIYTLNNRKTGADKGIGLSVLEFLRLEVLRLGYTVRFVDLQNRKLAQMIKVFFTDLRQAAERTKGYDSDAIVWRDWLNCNIIGKPKTEITLSFSSSPAGLKVKHSTIDVMDNWFFQFLRLRYERKTLETGYKKLVAALNMAEMIYCPEAKAETLSTMAFIQAMFGNLEEAHKIAAKIDEPGYLPLRFIEAFLEYKKGLIQECWERIITIINDSNNELHQRIEEFGVCVMVELLINLEQDHGPASLKKATAGLLESGVVMGNGLIDKYSLTVLLVLQKHYNNFNNKSENEKGEIAIFLAEQVISSYEQGKLSRKENIDASEKEVNDFVINSFLMLSEAYKSREQLDKAESILMEAARYFPDSSLISIHLVYLYVDYAIRAILNQEVSSARQYYAQAMDPLLVIKTNKDFKELEFYHGIIELMGGNATLARDIFQKTALLATPEVLSKFYITVHSAQLSSIFFNMLSDRNLSNDARFNLARMLAMAAQDNLKDMAGKLVNLIDENFRAADYEQAVDLVIMAGILDSKNKEIRRREGKIKQFLEFQLKAQTAFMKDNLYETERNLKLACGLSPEDANLKEWLTETTLKLNQEKLAKEERNKALNDARSLIFLARGQLNKGKYIRGINNFRKAIEALVNYNAQDTEVEQLRQKANQGIASAEKLEKEIILTTDLTANELEGQRVESVKVTAQPISDNFPETDVAPPEQANSLEVWMTQAAFTGYENLDENSRRFTQNKFQRLALTNSHESMNMESMPKAGVNVYKLKIDQKRIFFYCLDGQALVVVGYTPDHDYKHFIDFVNKSSRSIKELAGDKKKLEKINFDSSLFVASHPVRAGPNGCDTSSNRLSSPIQTIALPTTHRILRSITFTKTDASSRVNDKSDGFIEFLDSLNLIQTKGYYDFCAGMYEGILPKAFNNCRVFIHSIMRELVLNLSAYVHWQQPDADYFMRLEEIKDSNGVFGIRLFSIDNGYGIRIPDILEHPSIKNHTYPGTTRSAIRGIFLAGLKEMAQKHEEIVLEAISNGQGVRYSSKSGKADRELFFWPDNQTIIAITVFPVHRPLNKGAFGASSPLSFFNLFSQNWMPDWFKGLNVYVAFWRDCPKMGTDPDRWGDTSDLIWLFNYIEELG